MSYEIYKHRNNAVRTHDHWLYSLVGKGEHEGTILTFPQEQIFQHKFDSEAAMAAFLDREFSRAHATRTAIAIEAQRAATTQIGAVADESAGPQDIARKDAA